MVFLTRDFKQKVVKVMLSRRELYDGPDASFAKSLGLAASIYTRLKKGETDRILRTSQWLELAQYLDVEIENRSWRTARTDVFNAIEEDIMFCKSNAKSMIFVDDCGIGKTYTARYLAKTVRNCFYVDASQAKTKGAFIRLVARTIGADSKVIYREVKESLKYFIKTLQKPIIIIDEAGDLEYGAFLELKELWNATEGYCGWYLMGADGLRAKIERGISNRKVGYAEIFSRYSEKFTTIVPREKSERNRFYRKLIVDTLTANNCPVDQVNEIVRRCMTNDSSFTGGLRRAESLLILQKPIEKTINQPAN